MPSTSNNHESTGSAPLAAHHDLPLLVAAPHADLEGSEEYDSTLGDDVTVSTASVASSILQYRTLHGRRYHSEKYAESYFAPNDDQHQESLDIAHHYLQLLLDGALFLAPIPETVKKVIDIGTGTGIWAIEFADLYPDAKVIGTDLAPMQPLWVPPNLKFELDDAAMPWTWAPDTFDFIHMRYLVGSIADWKGLFAEAYRCCAPGGYLQSCEINVNYKSDDNTLLPVYTELWHLFEEAGIKSGRSFRVIEDNLQRKALEAAGFINIEERMFKVPKGGWPADPKLAEIGQYARLVAETDTEGYTTFLWNDVLKRDPVEYQIFLADLRKALKNKKCHCYALVKYIWGQKPMTG